MPSEKELKKLSDEHKAMLAQKCVKLLMRGTQSAEYGNIEVCVCVYACACICVYGLHIIYSPRRTRQNPSTLLPDQKLPSQVVQPPH